MSAVDRERRKEVALGRLRTLTILLTLSAWGAATDGAPPDDSAAPAVPSARPNPPAPPSVYVKTGAELLGKGQVELGAKYLKAANDYRDQLTDAERADLDKLRQALIQAPATAPRPAPAPVIDAVAPAPVVSGERPARVGTTDAKQRGRWLLQQAREQIAHGEYDEARAKLDEARGLDVHWGLFDDTPAKVAESLNRARPRTAAAVSTAAGNRQQAKARLKEARAALAANRYDQAESISQEVNAWGLTYGMFDDSPKKVSAAARALRDRDVVRKFGTKGHAGQEVYEVLVNESRELLKAGRLQEAEAKALRAQKMNIVPAVTADRAETVLADLSVLKANAAQAQDGAKPPAIVEAKSAVVESAANALLADNHTEAAKAKYAEAEQLHAVESGLPAAVDPIAMAPPLADPAVEKVQAAADAPAAVPEMPPITAPAPPAALTLEPAQADLSAPAPPQANPGLPDLSGEAPAPEPNEAPAPAPAPPSANPGALMIGQARGLMIKGNYAEAREVVAKAKAGGFGVEAQADELAAQITQSEQAGALSLFEAAVAALRKNENERARALLNEISTSEVQLDEGLAQKVQDLLLRLPKAGEGRATATDLANTEEAIKVQQLNAEIGIKMAESRRLMDTDPERAIVLLQQQIEAVKAAGLGTSLTSKTVRRLEIAIESARKDKVAFETKMRDKKFKEEIERKRFAILQADVAKKQQVKTFMERAEKAMSNGDYAEAEKFAERAQTIAPNEIAPGALAWKARVQRHYDVDLKTRAAKEEGFLAALHGVDVSSIADPVALERGISYPTTFADLTKQRGKYDVSRAYPKSPQAQLIEQKLNEAVDLNFSKTPLEEVVTHLQNLTGLNFILDYKALADEQIVPTTPVSLTVNKVKLKTVLKLILKPLGLSYRQTDEVVLITSPQTSRTDLVTRAYDVADLVVTPHRKGNQPQGPHGPNPPGMTSAMPDVSTSEGQAAARANAGALPGTNGLSTQPQSIMGDRPDIDMTPLVQLITASIAPNTWRVGGADGTNGQAFGYGQGIGGGAGGADAQDGETVQPGSITPFMLNISLIIRHTAEVHEEVVDLLRQLRKLQDLQISVEVRFITLDDNFFEQIGVDFDVSIHSNVAGRGSSFAVNPLLSAGGTGGTAGTAGVFGGTAGSGGTAATAGTAGTGTGYLINPIRDHTFGNRQPLTVGRPAAGDTGNFTPDLQIPFTNGSYAASTVSNTVPNVGSNFGIAFLSDLEVYLFLTAAQGDSRSNLVQAPKVTSFNGALATVISVNEINYVASLFPLIGAGAGSFIPQIATIQDGVTLSVTPVVSADRRYVRMTLSPSFITFSGFDNISVPIVAGGGGLGGGGAVANATIQLPRLTRNTVQTTVTVPDGGTVLLGGVKRLREQRTEYGTPILSKTPFINRLFRNIGIGRTTDSLMLMVTPRIIILEEEEEKLGIPTVPTISL